jgi:hypothetical protein
MRIKALTVACVALMALTGCGTSKSEPKPLVRGFSYRLDTGINHTRIELIHDSGIKAYGEIGVEYEF